MISDTNEALKRKNFHLYTNNYIPFLISDEVWDYYMDFKEADALHYINLALDLDKSHSNNWNIKAIILANLVLIM